MKIYPTVPSQFKSASKFVTVWADDEYHHSLRQPVISLQSDQTTGTITVYVS